MTDPWSSESNTQNNIEQELQNKEEAPLEFEDNFAPARINSPLHDSKDYLQGLERKLQRIKKSSKLLEALAEKRQATLRTFLQDEVGLNDIANLELDIPINNIDSAVQEICRQLQPIQPVTVGETLHIVHYDQLEQQRLAVEEETETEPASR